MPATFDNDTGEFVEPVRQRAGRFQAASPRTSLGWLLDGGALWEILHPGTVQKEDAAIGAKPRTVAEIESDAINQAIGTARNDVATTFDTGSSLVKWLIVGIVAVAVIQVAGRIPAPKGASVRSRVVKHYRKRAARAISRRIAG